MMSSPGLAKRKIDESQLFNCENLDEFMASIVETFGYHGMSMARFYTCDLDGMKFFTKVCFYYKTDPEVFGKEGTHTLHPTDAEISILKVFKDKLISQNITPCILELVHEKICPSVTRLAPDKRTCKRLLTRESIETFEQDLLRDVCKYCDLVKNGFGHDKIAFLVLEKCDITLGDYLEESMSSPVSITVFKSLLFMIIHAIYVITKLYTRFHHYDLHTSNIMLKFDPNYKFNATNPKFSIFTIDGVRYSVPYFGITPKIIDFGYSVLPEEGIISVQTEHLLHMFHRAENDILLLFYFIDKIVAEKKSDRFGRIDKLLSKLDPTRSYVNYYVPLIREQEKIIPTYEDMVKNSVWDEYRNYSATGSQVYNEFTPV